MPASIAAGGMSSARWRLRTTRCLSFSAHGASVKPQLPITTVVMPCQQEDVPSGSQKICASMWVWPSTKPGATTWPSASMTSCALSRMRPIVAILPSLHADVRAIAGQAGTVDHRAVLDHQVVGHPPPFQGSQPQGGPSILPTKKPAPPFFPSPPAPALPAPGAGRGSREQREGRQDQAGSCAKRRVYSGAVGELRHVAPA